MIYQTIALATLFAAANANKLYFADPVQQKYMWDQFKQEYGKVYATESEETTRFSNFLNNLLVAEKRNEAEKANNGTAVHGITKFFDLSQDEFASRYLRSDASKRVAVLTCWRSPPHPRSTLALWTGLASTLPPSRIKDIAALAGHSVPLSRLSPM